MRIIALRSLALIAALSVAACAATPDQQEESLQSRGSTTLTEQDTACLLEAVYFEARAKDLEGGKAVAHVILNRAQDPRFPSSVCGVVADGQSRGHCQFSYRCDSRPEVFRDKIKLAGAEQAVEVVALNPDEDNTDGALFFHAARMNPGWFGTLRRTITVGGHIFYR